jgi:hypothetical protein
MQNCDMFHISLSLLYIKTHLYFSDFCVKIDVNVSCIMFVLLDPLPVCIDSLLHCVNCIRLCIELDARMIMWIEKYGVGSDCCLSQYSGRTDKNHKNLTS